MRIYAINYDLKQPGYNYSKLYEAIRSLAVDEQWQHPLESMWVISVQDDIRANDIFQALHDKMDGNDSLFIVDITMRDRQGWLSESFWTWMKGK